MDGSEQRQTPPEPNSSLRKPTRSRRKAASVILGRLGNTKTHQKRIDDNWLEGFDWDMSKASLLTLLQETHSCLELARKDNPHLHHCLSFIDALAPAEGSLNDVAGNIPAHSELLDTAISSISVSQFSGLRSALTAAKSQLLWRVDDGGFYAEDADVGDGYRNGNMHTLLIGPQDSLIQAPDFLLGFFLLAPNTFYRDHKHQAPELYIPLTGPSGWRFDLGEWQELDAGTVIYNAPDIVHATRVYETPFLALFAWTRNISSVCSVVFSDDWREVETGLRASFKNAPT